MWKVNNGIVSKEGTAGSGTTVKKTRNERDKKRREESNKLKDINSKRM